MLAKMMTKGDFSRVNDEEKEIINKKLEKFLEAHSFGVSEMRISLDCHLHKETSRGRPAYYVKINIDSDKGRFHAEHQDYGVEKTISATLKKIDVQIKKKHRPKL